jgi:hypothetical protein
MGRMNVGAIVGGVIGGVVALAAIALAMFFWILRRRRQIHSSRGTLDLADENKYASTGGYSDSQEHRQEQGLPTTMYQPQCANSGKCHFHFFFHLECSTSHHNHPLTNQMTLLSPDLPSPPYPFPTHPRITPAPLFTTRPVPQVILMPIQCTPNLVSLVLMPKPLTTALPASARIRPLTSRSVHML